MPDIDSPPGNAPPGKSPPRSLVAVVSFWLGLGSLFLGVFAGLPALVLGVIGFFNVVLAKGKLRGTFLSLSGAALGVFGTWWSFYAMAHARDGSLIFSSMRSLRFVGKGIAAYGDSRDFLPAPIDTRPGEAPRSWRVSILPFLDSVEIFDDYRLDEPWNSQHNQRFVTPTHWPYSSVVVSGKPTGMTNIVAIVGDNTVWPPGERIRLTDVQDAASETLVLIEVARSNIPWTEPRDMTIDDFAKGIDQPGGPQSIYSQGLLAYFADGEVRIIPRDASPEQLRALATRNGGERITIQFAEVGHE